MQELITSKQKCIKISPETSKDGDESLGYSKLLDQNSSVGGQFDLREMKSIVRSRSEGIY